MAYDYLSVWASLVLCIVVAVACLRCCMVAVWFGCSGLEYRCWICCSEWCL